jgi:hypothetical protein
LVTLEHGIPEHILRHMSIVNHHPGSRRDPLTRLHEKALNFLFRKRHLLSKTHLRSES